MFAVFEGAARMNHRQREPRLSGDHGSPDEGRTNSAAVLPVSEISLPDEPRAGFLPWEL